jgi:hypothetical protein
MIFPAMIAGGDLHTDFLSSHSVRRDRPLLGLTYRHHCPSKWEFYSRLQLNLLSHWGK